MKVSKGQSQPEIVAAAAFLILYVVLGLRPFILPGFDCDSVRVGSGELKQPCPVEA